MRLMVVVGARPNVVKVGPLIPVLVASGVQAEIVFSGSREAYHPEDRKGAVSFYGVELPEPRWCLDVGSGTDASLAGKAMVAFEQLFATEKPDAIMVVGDVTTSLAAAISAVKSGIPVVHLEAGLRCGDLGIPEEVNRVLISRVASMHLSPTEIALENLQDEGIDPERIHFVGNMLAESVLRSIDSIGHEAVSARGLTPRRYILASFHRPENLSSAERLKGILDGLAMTELPSLVPDTQGLTRAVEAHGISVGPGVDVVEAVPYRDMLALVRDAAVVVTDSGGLQEEACVIGTPCLTVRECTEHTATTEAGANRMVAASPAPIRDAIASALGEHGTWLSPRRWDSAVSSRVCRALRRGIVPLR